MFLDSYSIAETMRSRLKKLCVAVAGCVLLMILLTNNRSLYTYSDLRGQAYSMTKYKRVADGIDVSAKTSETFTLEGAIFTSDGVTEAFNSSIQVSIIP